MIELKAGCVRVLQNRKHLFNQQLPCFARVGEIEMSVEGVDSVREGSGKFDFLNPSPSLFLHTPPPSPNAKDEPRRGFFFSTILNFITSVQHVCPLCDEAKVALESYRHRVGIHTIRFFFSFQI